jgi:putative phosphoribosyl transferase
MANASTTTKSDYRFKDRVHAGQLLAAKLRPYARRSDVIVVGLARGGVPVAREVAQALGAPLEVLVVRKLGLPDQPELAMGAIAAGGVQVMDEALVRECGISARQLAVITLHEQAELARRERLYRQNRPPITVGNKCVILVDDGMATGLTMRAAIKAMAQQKPARVMVAVPVAARATCDELANDPDCADMTTCVCTLMPDVFYAVGVWYEHFPQTTDEEVCAALRGSPMLQDHPGEG